MVTAIVKMINRKLSLFVGMFLMVLLLGSGVVSASYYNQGYGNNYGYENYYPSYNYRHSYGNSAPNQRGSPNLVSISSKDRYDNGYVYSSTASSYRSYNSYYPGYSGVKTYDRQYVLDRYYPYNSYVNENSYYEGSSPYSYNQHSESNFRLLSRPEHYMYLWSYR